MAGTVGTTTIVVVGVGNFPKWGTLQKEAKQRAWEEYPVFCVAKFMYGP